MNEDKFFELAETAIKILADIEKRLEEVEKRLEKNNITLNYEVKTSCCMGSDWRNGAIPGKVTVEVEK